MILPPPHRKAKISPFTLEAGMETCPTDCRGYGLSRKNVKGSAEVG